MAEDITYIRSPEGKTVVLVPIKQPDLDVLDSTNQCCWACGLVWMIVGVTFMIIGAALTGVALDSRSPATVLLKIGLIELGGGGFVVFCSILMCCYSRSIHSEQVEKYMYRGDGEQRQPIVSYEEAPVEDDNPASYSQNLRMNRFSEQPEVPVHGLHPGNYRTTYSSQSHEVPIPDSRPEAFGRVSPNQVLRNEQRRSYPSPMHHSSYPSVTASPLFFPPVPPERTSSLSNRSLLSPDMMMPGEDFTGRTSPNQMSLGRTHPRRRSPTGRTSPNQMSLGRTHPRMRSPTGRTSPNQMSLGGTHPGRRSPYRSSPYRSSPYRSSPVQRAFSPQSDTTELSQ